MRNAIYLAFLLLFAALPSFALENPDEQCTDRVVCPPPADLHMTGTWSGTRTDLEAKGVTFCSSYVLDILGNVRGGIRQGARFDSSMGWDVNFDLEKFAGQKGTQFHISGLWRAGQNLSSAVIGNALTASSIFGSEQFRLYAMYLQKTFLKEKINIQIGRIATGDDFAASPIYWNFVTNAIDGNPITIPINLFFPTYPTAVWGARAICNITKDIYTISGIYDGDPRVGRLAAYGLDFSLRLKRGILFAQEVAYAPNTAPDSKGLPGHYKVGFFYNGSIFRDLSTDINGASFAITGLPAKKRVGNYAVYFHADQMVYRKGGAQSQVGLTPFFVIAIGPDDTNQFPFFVDGGMVYQGLIPTRNSDITSVGISYAQYSGSLQNNQRDNIDYNGSMTAVQTYELAFDFSHKVSITPWMYLQPDMQYIINPNGWKARKNAYVVGTRFGLIF